MDIEVPETVAEFGAAAATAFGGPEAGAAWGGARDARIALMERAERLGLDDLNIGSRIDDTLAAGFVAREGGRVAAPIPLPAMLTARAAEREGIVAAIGNAAPGEYFVDHADLFDEIATVAVNGELFRAMKVAAPKRSRPLAPFAGRVRIAQSTGLSASAWPAHELFSAFSTLGALEVAVDLTARYINERHQFGRPIARFQAVSHRLAAAVVAVQAMVEVCLYMAWRYATSPESRLVDALVLRRLHIESTRTVMRNCHQAHGAIGFCDEYPLSVFSRFVTFQQFVPLDFESTGETLSHHISELPSLYPSDGIRTGKL
jgi:hypothetical protein